MSKTWLVTGGARGLGRHIAEAVLAAGDNLVATARDPGRLSDLQDRYDDHICVATLDVTDALAARTAVQAATKAFGRLDVLVNNAGFGHVAPFECGADGSSASPCVQRSLLCCRGRRSARYPAHRPQPKRIGVYWDCPNFSASVAVPSVWKWAV